LRLCLGVKKEEEWRKRKMEGIHHLIRERERECFRKTGGRIFTSNIFIALKHHAI
jgi:hypothetical protein